jgi:hypothetical protein
VPGKLFQPSLKTHWLIMKMSKLLTKSVTTFGPQPNVMKLFTSVFDKCS